MNMSPGDGDNTLGLLIERFKSGDPEVVYEKIKSAAELALDSMDGDTRLGKYPVSGLPVPHCSVEERLRPLNPFYRENLKKPRFVPTIEPAVVARRPISQETSKSGGSPSPTGRSPHKHIHGCPIVKNSSEKAFKKRTAEMPVSYNSFLASNSITPDPLEFY